MGMLKRPGRFWGHGVHPTAHSPSTRPKATPFYSCSLTNNPPPSTSPYYGGPQGFETVLDLLDDACTGLLRHIQQEKGGK
jgi:protein-tyrosine phosphatase